MAEEQKAWPKENPALAQAVEEIRAGGCSCVLIRGGEIVFRGEGRGVAPIRRLYESEDGKALLKGALLADKILGKAAAMLLVLGGVQAAHGETVSEAALGYLSRRGIPCSYTRRVEAIKSRDGQGLCPIEQSVLGIESPEEGYRAITKTIAKLMAQNT